MNASTEDRIIDLWPTHFLHYALEGHADYRDALTDLAARHSGEDVLSRDDAALVWLKQHVGDAATAYLTRYAGLASPNVTVTGRAVVHNHGDYQPLRNHPDAYLSGIYTITAPKDLRDDHHRSDVDSNAISFYDPRFAMNMGAIAKDPNADMEKLVRPEPGILIMWPSFVDFFIHPNLSAEPQLSIHFKVTLDAHS